MVPAMALDPDELGRTLTASPNVPPTSEVIGTTLGRYRIEREIGAGGMGVVHAAFDPDLERRVALKVLRGSGSDDLRQRLLREARAMARLAHPNVVVVHEVGSANGRDFVAMELIDGETLADWVRDRPRTIGEIMAAFIAAGRGLAAAHRAELVHRDFKPHNVLRSRDGRILVTDFGLARSTESAALATTVPLHARIESNAPSALSGLTQTGSLLGTPAYMAPEQWSGGKIGPATDQFAFCVALWEALAGKRPFSGLTVDELRAEIERGPEQLDVSKLPRRLRKILRRGLSRDPEARWPSMDALLAALVRSERRPYVALAIAGGAMVAAIGIAAVALHGDRAETCDLALRDPDIVWSKESRASFVTASSERTAKLFDADVAAWKQARVEACTAPATVRHARLHCLDGVLARLDAVRRSTATTSPIDDENLAGELLAPAICMVDVPPRLPTELSPAAIDGIALRERPPAQPFDRTRLKAALDRAGTDTCARAMLLLASTDDDKSPHPRDTAEESAQAAESCGDDRTAAEALLVALVYQINAFMDAKQQALLHRVEDAVKRVAQPNLVASLDVERAKIARVTEQPDEAARLYAAAVVEFGDRFPRARLGAELSRIHTLLLRHTSPDLATARAEIAIWRPRAEAAHFTELAYNFAVADAHVTWFSGNVAAGSAELARLLPLAPPPAEPPNEPRSIHGVVVDVKGKPVAGARVAAATVLIGDAVSISVGFDRGLNTSFATTDANGAYRIDHVPAIATVMAQLGDRRSQPVVAGEADRLVLAPTTHVRGKVVATGVAVTTTMVVVISNESNTSPMYQQVAPVAPDGSYELDGVLVGKARIGALVQRGVAGQAFALVQIEPGLKGLDNVALPFGTGRRVRVVVRSASSAPLSGARAMIVPGKLVIKTVRDMMQVLRGNGMEIAPAHGWIGEPPAELAGKLAAGDLVATFETAPLGETSLCAMGLSGDLSDPALEDKLVKHGDELELTCQTLAADATVVTIDVPAMKRLD